MDPSQPNTHAPSASAGKACANCKVRDQCIPRGLSPQQVLRFEALAGTPRKVTRGMALYRGGEAFDSLFAIRGGSFKTFMTAAGAREQVTGFHLPGETIGLDGIAHHRHTGGAVALEDAQVCALPFAGLSEMEQEAGALHLHLHLHLHHIMSREIVRGHGIVLLLGSMRAEQRMAALLINLSERLHARGLSPVDLVLRMSRGEIGSYLGMKLETVSRTFARLVDEGAIDINLRQLRILDMGALRRHLHLRGTLAGATPAAA